MQFENPSILWFLFALIIPIIIHLFYFRRYKKVYFSDTRFLMEAQEVQKNASRLKHLLVLLTRLLIMAFLIVAFAQPFLPANNQQSEQAANISFFIDNSYSMDAGGQQQSLLEEAKSIAIESINQYPDYYSFHIFDHNFAGEDQQWTDKENAINKVRRTQRTGKVKTLSQIDGRMNQMRQRLNDQTSKMDSYVITDGQTNIFSSLPDFDTDQRIQIVRLNPVRVSNVAVDSAWVQDIVLLPGQESQLFVQVTNYGAAEVDNVRLSFTSDGQTRPASVFDLASGQSVIDTLPISFPNPGWKELRFAVDDESIRFDDELLLTLAVTDFIDVLLVSDNDRVSFFRAAVQSSDRSTFTHSQPGNLIYSELDRYDLIIVDGLKELTSGLATELENYIKAGGNLIFFPHADGNLDSYNRLLRTLDVNTFRDKTEESMAVFHINTSSFIFKNVYRRTGTTLKTPTANTYFTLTSSPVEGKERLLDFRNNAPYLTGYQRRNGNLFLCTSPTDNSSSDILTSGSFFVPMLHRMSISSRSGIAPFYEIGTDKPMSVNTASNVKDPVYKLSGETEVIPAVYKNLRLTNLYAGEQIETAGFYQLSTQDTMLAKIAFNYNRSESDLSTLDADEIRSLAPDHIQVISAADEIDVATALVSKSKNTNLWRYCLYFALLLLAIEQLLLRHFKS